MDTAFEADVDNELAGVYESIHECVAILEDRDQDNELLWFHVATDEEECDPLVREEYLKRFAPETGDLVEADIAYCEALVEAINQMQL